METTMNQTATHTSNGITWTERYIEVTNNGTAGTISYSNHPDEMMQYQATHTNPALPRGSRYSEYRTNSESEAEQFARTGSATLPRAKKQHTPAPPQHTYRYDYQGFPMAIEPEDFIKAKGTGLLGIVQTLGTLQVGKKTIAGYLVTTARGRTDFIFDTDAEIVCPDGDHLARVSQEYLADPVWAAQWRATWFPPQAQAA
jgi:hypothetical protein